MSLPCLSIPLLHFSLWLSFNQIMTSCHKNMNAVIRIIMASCQGSCREWWTISKCEHMFPYMVGWPLPGASSLSLWGKEPIVAEFFWFWRRAQKSGILCEVFHSESVKIIFLNQNIKYLCVRCDSWTPHFKPCSNSQSWAITRGLDMRTQAIMNQTVLSHFPDEDELRKKAPLPLL